MEPGASHLPAIGAELITVLVGGQLFAIDIMSVREIRGWGGSTPLPHAPPGVLGMFNLRGAVLAVVDLASRVGFAPTTPGPSSVVVVADMGDRQVGLLVDAVCDILKVTENMLQAAPDVGSPTPHDFVDGVMTTEAGIVGLLSLRNILPTLAERMAA